jgi:hypothetical protein
MIYEKGRDVNLMEVWSIIMLMQIWYDEHSNTEVRKSKKNDMKASRGVNLVIWHWVWNISMALKEEGVGTNSKPERVEEHMLKLEYDDG